jgi:hypothetical protein
MEWDDWRWCAKVWALSTVCAIPAALMLAAMLNTLAG